MTDVLIDARRGAGSSLEILYGTVTWKPTLTHSRGTSIVLPAPTTYDLVDGQVVATNVQPTPEPVAGQIEWAYEVTFKDRHGKTYSFLVGVPDSTSQVNFISLPRYFETKPPLFGAGPKGDPGESATVAVGTVTGGTTAQVNNSGTSTDAVLDFVLPQGPQGPKGDGVTYLEPGSKNFSDEPVTYPNGISYMYLSSVGSTGWPEGFAGVWTYKANSPARTHQRFVANNSSKVLERRSNTASVWQPFKEVAWSDLATTTANGLMSSADKSKLEGITPDANSKPFSALASTYSAGVSIVQVRASDGWPLATKGTVVTHKTATDSTAVGQWLYPAEGGEPLYRSSNASGLWTEFSTIATQSWVASNKDYVTPEQFGAVGDGTTDDTVALQSALDKAVAENKQLLLKGGTVYRTVATLRSAVPTSSTDVKIHIGTYGAGKPTIRLQGTTTQPVMELKGAVMATATLTAEVKILDRGWSASSVSGFNVGNLLAVRSSASWYYDPRPESTDARKSELHKVASVSGGVIYVAAPAEDGYRPATESVELISIKPIQVTVENINFHRDLPPEGTSADNLRRVGLRIDYADEPKLTNLGFYGMTASGIRMYESYNGAIRDCSIEASNNYFEGYAITVAGCAHTLVEKCYVGTSRRGVDVSQGNYVVARHTTISKCVVTGGGKSSRGEWFGWDPNTGGLASRQSGLGSHGAADFTSYLDNTIYTMTEMLSCNGGNEIIKGNIFIGKTNLACIGLGLGGGFAIIENNVAVSGYLGTDKWQYLLGGRRPNQFVKVNTNWNGNGNARLEVRNNYAEVQTEFICFGSQSPATVAMPTYVTVTGNRVGFSNGTTAPGYLLYNPEATVKDSGTRWTIGMNDIKHDANAGSANVTRNINLNGAKVLNYTTSGPTT